MSRGHRFFHIDVFTRVPGQGNPAAVVVGAGAIPDREKQMIARELGLPGTGFLWSDPDRSDAEEPNTFRVRFFTPEREVSLSGHTALASAHAFFSFLGEDLPLDALRVRTRSETLTVERDGAWLWLTLPPPALAPYGGAPREVCQALGLGEDDLRRGVPLELSREPDLLIPLSPETDIGRVTPDPRALVAKGSRLWIKVVAWAFVPFQILLVLSARTHYTIDVLGGLFVAYATHRVSLDVATVLNRSSSGDSRP